MNDSDTESRSSDVEQLVELIARATALCSELAAIKAKTPLALFALKVRDARFAGVRSPDSRIERSPIVNAAARMSADDAERAARLLGDLGSAVTSLEGERDAIERESPLGLFVRKALGKMPPAGALPVFSTKRLRRVRVSAPPFARMTVKAGRLVAGGYRRLRVRTTGLPRITIVMPASGAGDGGRARASVLAQNYPGVDVIVAGGEIAEAFARADGEVLGYLNADDELEPRALERVGRYFATHPRARVICYDDIVERDGWRFPSAARPASLHQSGVFFRRRVRRASTFAPVWRPGQVCVVAVPRQARDDMGALARLFFPVDACELPPPAALAPAPPVENPPVCPLTGEVPDRLLFSSPDTRLGYDPLSYIYYVPQSHLAMAYPVLDEDLLTERRERAAVNPPRAVTPAPGTSPYRNYRATGLLPRLIASLVLPAAGEAPADRRFHELLIGLRIAGMRRLRPASFLSIGCRDTSVLDRLRATTPWTVAAVESDRRAAERARAAGHDIRFAGVASAGSMFPLDQQFDVVRIEEIDRYNDPVAAVAAVRTLMAVGAHLIIATPNLDSAQIDIFGPTWSGWRPPYHRFVFSVAALRLLAERSNMQFVGYRTVSDPALTATSLLQQQHGLGALVPDDATVPPATRFRARSIRAWSQRLFDARGKGDRIVAVFRKRG